MIEERSGQRPRVLVPGDYRGLERRYTVRYDHDDRAVILTDVDLPEDWEPQRIAVAIKLPRHYPDAGPRWEFPGTIRHDGTVPRHLLVAGNWLVRGTLGDPWIYWPPDWNPEASTLVEETDRALSELTADCASRPEVVSDDA